MSGGWWRRWVPPLVFIAVVLGAWELAVVTKVIDFETIPAPGETLSAWREIASSGQLWTAVGHSLRMLAISFLFAALAGVVLGTAIGTSRTAYAYLHGILEFLRFVPPVALIPVVLLISGFSDRTEIAVASFASLWPILLNTASGVEGVDAQLREVGRSLRLPRRHMLVKLVLPAALPTIAVGLRIALSLCLIMVITTEIVAIPQGLGFELLTAGNTLRPDIVYAYLLSIGAVGVLTNIAFRFLERRVLLRGWGNAWEAS